MHTDTISSSVAVPLDSTELPLEMAGGKGAGLSRLMRAGFPVPSGFVIASSAYRTFIEANGIAGDIAAGDALVLRRKFDSGELPAAIADAVLAAYRELTTGALEPVAVRSSATTEDLASVSSAGQHDTYLNVIGEAALLRSVRACWASLWSERALAYRAHHHVESSNVSMAVVVQHMVAADAAGVLFTVNPVNGNDEEVMINATWGLGDTLVSGAVEPDELVLDKSSGVLKSLTIGDKAVMTVVAASGTRQEAVEASRRSLPALTTAQATELALFGRDIEAALGGAQDIEWALTRGRPVILQARPVTHLSGRTSETPMPGDDAWLVRDEQPAQPFDMWTHADMGERWPDPVTPMTWSLADATTNANFRFTLRDLGADKRHDIQWARRFYGRVYMNEGGVAELLFQAGLPTSIADKALGSGVPASLRRNAPLSVRRLLRALPRIVRTSLQRYRNEAVYEAMFFDVDRWMDEFDGRDLAEATDAEVWRDLQQTWMPRIRRGIDLHGDATSEAMAMLAVLEWLVERSGGGEHLARELLSGIDDVRAAEMAPALYAIAREIRQAGLANIILANEPRAALEYLRTEPAAATALGMLGRFLRRHGHRARIEGELRFPRWSEAPEQVVAALIGYLQDPPVRDPREVEAATRRQLRERQADLDARLSPLRRWILHRLVTRAKRLVRLRDNGQHNVVRLLLPIRRLCAELGIRWAERDWLAEPDDIFFLLWTEVATVVATGNPAQIGRDLRTIVAARRAAYEYWFSVPAPEVVGADGRAIAQETYEGASATRLVGIAASGGRVSGVARIAHSPDEAALLQRGEILVARSTDPGWTPAFGLAGGLVLEVGGQLSHGAIVAREYGLPAVMNVRDALVRIRMGQTITVDGTLGCVYLHDAAEQLQGGVQ